MALSGKSALFYGRLVLSSAWIVLFFAGVLEVCWAIGLKYTDGFTRFAPSAFTLITLAGSMYLLSKAAQILPIGTAYAVWVGIGAFGAGVLGIVLFKEPVTPLRIAFMALLVISIIGLKFTAQ
jgi:quaternary ammonium compound-resistance protein SugE